MKVSHGTTSNGSQVAIGGALVVAGDDPDAGSPPTASTRTCAEPEHVAGRMEADAHAARGDGLPVGKGLDDGVRAEAAAEQAGSGRRAEVGGAPGPRVIAVRVGDDRASDRLPRVDVEAACRAEESVWAFDQHTETGTLNVLQNRTLLNTPCSI